MANKTLIMQALRKWIAQRPGLEFGNYGDVSSYRSEMRSITRDMHHARTMLDYIEWHDSITGDMILDAADNGGRLTITVLPHRSASQQLAYEHRRASGGICEAPPPDSEKVRIDYVTGQYWPIEYRRAVCALASSVIWSWLRDQALTGKQTSGDEIRKAARRELGRSIAQRWFN